MKRGLLFFLSFFAVSCLLAQPRINNRKYPSLLWEISGNGLGKPSYLIGTMHVSSKLAFNLPDSFYLAIRNAQVVALETNPETWQEDMNKFDLGVGYRSSFSMYNSMPSDYLSVNTLKFYKYDSKIERSLYSNPSTINNLLYRTYGNESNDFEEDTYLDMYIFQCGKKWGKQVTGVENYGESMQLMAEAYRDAYKDKKIKERSWGDSEDDYSPGKLQEAYRSGNLDLLDSINKYNSFSDAFDEKFLYRRNEIQAHSIDSIIRSGSTLFAGVGAAHLPGERGVIEILRRKGYTLRPVKMGERASHEKELVDKIRVPVSFHTETAGDGLFKVDIPGKFYKSGDDDGLDQRQYADMANGSYYMVTRVMTNAWLWGHTPGDVYKRIDSLLYENVPGRIISKTPLTKNGYKGFDLVNRTRRGDMQRYQVFITPFEIIFFKMSGNGDYVKQSEEAKKFFNSIRLKEYNPANEPPGLKKYSPPYGGFAVDLPHEPYIGNDGSWIYDAEDKANGINYRVVRTDIHNYHFVEEDTFDLGLLEQSFMSSEFIDKQVQRKPGLYKGYPVLDGKYRDKKGSLFLVRFLIQGPHYYTLIAHGNQETPVMNHFINSFEIRPFVYGEAKAERDTSLYYSVLTPVFTHEKKIRIDIPRYSYYGGDDGEEEETEEDRLEGGTYRSRIIGNDSTGERVFVSFFRSPRYYYSKDSLALDKDNEENFLGKDSSWVVRSRKKDILPDGTKLLELVIGDTASSRMLRGKSWYRNGVGFSLVTQTDTLSAPSRFISQYFDSFKPADTLQGINPFVKKSSLFFGDLSGADSVTRKRAMKSIDQVRLDSGDLISLEHAIARLSWKENKYLDNKKALINKLGGLHSNATADYLRETYYALGDTVDLQYVVLENLLQLRTKYAYQVFRDIINTEPPVLDDSKTTDYPDSFYKNYLRLLGTPYDINLNDGNFLDELSDSMQLTKAILPDLLTLLNLDDYKKSIMRLLGQLIDSNLAGAGDYQAYFSKFLLEAKQELKKQFIGEKKKAIEKAEAGKKTVKTPSYYGDEEGDKGNELLDLYAVLLMPYWDVHAAVQPLLQQMLQSGDKELKYNTFLLFVKNNKSCPDTLFTFFADQDDYRYRLYTDLRDLKQGSKFPASYNNHIDLGKSALLDKKSYGRPDSVIYMNRLLTEYKGRKGYVYFYKYKNKKDDASWKLATVGLVPEDPKAFEFTEEEPKSPLLLRFERVSSSKYNRYDCTRFTDTKINDNIPVEDILQKELRKMLYSLRKSAKEFYDEEDNSGREAGWSTGSGHDTPGDGRD